MLIKSQKTKRQTIGQMETLSFNGTQTWTTPSQNKKLVKIFVHALAGNTEPVLVGNNLTLPSHYAYWPDELTVAAGQTKKIDYVGEDIKFILATGGITNTVKVLPIYDE